MRCSYSTVAARLTALATAVLLLAGTLPASAQAAQTPLSIPENPASAVDGLTCRELSEQWFGDSANLLSMDGAEVSGNATHSAEAFGETGDTSGNSVEHLSVLSDYFTLRQDDFCTAPDAQLPDTAQMLSVDALPLSETVQADELSRMEHIREMEERLNILITDAVVTVRVDESRTLTAADGTITAYAYEWTFYDYDDLRDGEGGNDVSGYGTWHKLTLVPVSHSATESNFAPDFSGYILVSDEYDESDILGVCTIQESTREELSDFYGVPLDPGGELNAPGGIDEPYDGAAYGTFSGTDEIANDSNGAAYGTISGTDGIDGNPDEETAELQSIHYFADYDVAAAIEYSETYVYNYNPLYANFNSVGGDCANFSSQTIYAGGMPQVKCAPYGSDGWYYVTSTNRSATWAGSTQLRRWMGNNRGNLVNSLTVSTENQIFPGSPVFYTTKGDGTYQHTVICVTRNSAGRPLINSHNSDRYHVIWNYYTGSVRIDTVQLTSENVFGDFRGYDNSRSSFYAELYNDTYSRYVTNDGKGNVIADTSPGELARTWHFERQTSGAYRITSALDNSCIAVSGGGYLSRVRVQTESYDGSSGQLWYLYPKSGQGYLLRAGCTDRVLDIPYGSEYEEGTSLWTFGRNDIGTRTGVEAQIFQIREVDEPRDDSEVISTPVIQVEVSPSEGNGDNVTFTWNRVQGASYYRLKISLSGKLLHNIRVSGALTYALYLSAGDYSVVLEAYTANESSSTADSVGFTVRDVSYEVNYNANGGTGAPAAQSKVKNIALQLSERTPEYSGYHFVNWNTEPDGSGKNYAPGEDYTVNADVTFYALWKANTYRVSFDPNGGTLPPGREGKDVVYGSSYGNMPMPGRGEGEFLGWFADQSGSREIRPETIVQTAENHTLLALWKSAEPEPEPEPDPADIVPDVSADGETFTVHAAFWNLSDGALIFAAGYRDEQMISFDMASVNTVDGETILTLQGEVDTVKVMAVENGENLKPLGQEAVITAEQFSRPGIPGTTEDPDNPENPDTANNTGTLESIENSDTPGTPENSGMFGES